MKVDVVKVVKGVCLVGSVVCSLGMSWATGEENKKILAKLVDESLKK